ncbi:hypothetical protein Scep_029526 [Stephania cephalantha]|uniref:Uncharacterized protein n=1 Tax=Stephania cephalantha TaxID=152367 RepID=A0AAP0HHQ3_9MAGN
MFVLGHLLCEIPLSLPQLIIGYITSMCSFDRHLPYAHIITSYLESAQVDISLGGRPLSAYDTIDMATLKAMKYRYIRREQRWIREEDIPNGQHYEGYESPLPTDPPVAFDERDYLDYSFMFPHGDDGDDEVHQDFTAPPPPHQQSQRKHQPPHYPNFYGVAPPPEMSPSTAYLSAQLRYMHVYMTQTFTAIATRIEGQGDRLHRIEGHLLPAKLARDDPASCFGFHIDRDCRATIDTMSENVVERYDIKEENVITGDEAYASVAGTFGEGEAYPGFIGNGQRARMTMGCDRSGQYRLSHRLERVHAVPEPDLEATNDHTNVIVNLVKFTVHDGAVSLSEVATACYS